MFVRVAIWPNSSPCCLQLCCIGPRWKASLLLCQRHKRKYRVRNYHQYKSSLFWWPFIMIIIVHEKEMHNNKLYLFPFLGIPQFQDAITFTAVASFHNKSPFTVICCWFLWLELAWPCDSTKRLITVEKHPCIKLKHKTMQANTVN